MPSRSGARFTVAAQNAPNDIRSCPPAAGTGDHNDLKVDQ
jgi:hypothetical protein